MYVPSQLIFLLTIFGILTRQIQCRVPDKEGVAPRQSDGTGSQVGPLVWQCDWHDHNTVVCYSRALWYGADLMWYNCTRTYEGPVVYQNCDRYRNCLFLTEDINDPPVCMDLMLCEEFEIVAQDAIVLRYNANAFANANANLVGSRSTGSGASSLGGRVSSSTARHRIQFSESPALMGQPEPSGIRPQDICRVYAKGRPPRVKKALSSSSIHKAQVRVYFPDTMSESEMQAKLAQGFEISSISGRPDGVLTPEPFPDSGVVHLGSVSEVLRSLGTEIVY
ncbi:hypothetical protein V8F20_005986 [Naviculisporaceae sp. PSN 640]